MLDIKILDILHICASFVTLIVVLYYEFDRNRRIKNSDKLIQNRILNILTYSMNEAIYHSHESKLPQITRDLNDLMYKFSEHLPYKLWSLSLAYLDELKKGDIDKAFNTLKKMKPFFKYNKKKYKMIFDKFKDYS